MFCIIFALFEVRCACVNKYHQISNLYMAKKCSYVWTMRRTTPIEVRVVFFLNDEILLVFDFELNVQGKITFIGLCTHTPLMKYWRALDFPQNSSLFLICL